MEIKIEPQRHRINILQCYRCQNPSIRWVQAFPQIQKRRNDRSTTPSTVEEHASFQKEFVSLVDTTRKKNS